MTARPTPTHHRGDAPRVGANRTFCAFTPILAHTGHYGIFFTYALCRYELHIEN